ncbi:MAG: hypothetical protein PF447_05330 [Spirochaetaceae bacterium]|jgi:heme/copper-type cytochrome/quinol oxidase subunit 1|nr:hypothetical protein [Spirochaetaceae bacterium]
MKFNKKITLMMVFTAIIPLLLGTGVSLFFSNKRLALSGQTAEFIKSEFVASLTVQGIFLIFIIFFVLVIGTLLGKTMAKTEKEP